MALPTNIILGWEGLPVQKLQLITNFRKLTKKKGLCDWDESFWIFKVEVIEDVRFEVFRAHRIRENGLTHRAEPAQTYDRFPGRQRETGQVKMLLNFFGRHQRWGMGC